MAEVFWGPEEVASYLGLPIGTLYGWRSRDQGPRATKIGRHLRYRKTDVMEWLASLEQEQEARRVSVTIAGQNDLSQQLLDRTAPNMDVFLAAELGRAQGEQIDLQVLNGSGSAGQTRGLLNTVGITTRTYTDATPTQAEFFSALMGLYSDFASALGQVPDTLLLAPRRAAWLEAPLASSNVEAFQRLGVTVKVVPAMPLTLGGGTEDRAIFVRSEEIDLYLDQPKIRLFDDVLSGNLQVRFQVYQYAALLGSRQPLATGVLAGTGLAAAGITF